MRTLIGVMSTSQAAVVTAEPAEPAATVTRRPDDDERAEEAFEATILRLDGAAFEWLLRQLGE
ncbi:MAG TPA: hypothetical protein VGS80_00165 [Ktedonobacterales bacterium]|nr:hypothetical protein [Ktedonobacterales bacterium]